MDYSSPLLAPARSSLKWNDRHDSRQAPRRGSTVGAPSDGRAGREDRRAAPSVRRQRARWTKGSIRRRAGAQRFEDVSQRLRRFCNLDSMWIGYNLSFRSAATKARPWTSDGRSTRDAVRVLDAASAFVPRRLRMPLHIDAAGLMDVDFEVRLARGGRTGDIPRGTCAIFRASVRCLASLHVPTEGSNSGVSCDQARVRERKHRSESYSSRR
jgi:hypothetical protein